MGKDNLFGCFLNSLDCAERELGTIIKFKGRVTVERPPPPPLHKPPHKKCEEYECECECECKKKH